MAAYLITHNPDASVLDCLNAILELIPSLKTYLIIFEKSDNGNIRCSIKSYAFQTPKKTVKSPVTKSTVPVQNKESTNRYEYFNEHDDTKNTDNLLFSKVTLPSNPDDNLLSHSESLDRSNVNNDLNVEHNLKDDISNEKNKPSKDDDDNEVEVNESVSSAKQESTNKPATKATIKD